MLDNKTIDDAQLNSKLGHIGKHFKIDIYKDSTIIGGKIAVKEGASIILP